MAKFDDLTITNNGLDMIALSQSGAKLIFTKIKLGDGQIGDNDVMKLTDIINERMTSQISSIEAKGEGQVAIKFTVDNSELTSGFFVREIGIFAKINEGGEEKLYAYTNAGNYTNYLADNKTPIDAIITKIDLAIGNATDINFTVDKSIIYVSLEDLETNLQKHNSNIDSHTEAFTKHNDDENAHDNLIKKLFDLSEVTLESIKSKIKDWSKEVCLPLSGGTMKGNINANGYNITATKFIGNLQGKADSAANADLAKKANQDSQGQTINTTYVKGVTVSNATLTITKGNGTTSTVTINNVAHSTNSDTATKAIADKNGLQIDTNYLKNTGGSIIGNYYTSDNILRIKTDGDNTTTGVGIAVGAGSVSIVDYNESAVSKYPLQYFPNNKYVTTITPPTSDNSRCIATTAFVKSLFTASKQQNGWWKEASTGIIWQWGNYANPIQLNNNASIDCSVQFPISFTNCIQVIPILYERTDINGVVALFYKNKTNSSVDIVLDLYSYNSVVTGTARIGYIAIGY